MTELVKMKSLATDEIGLDAALAAAGVEAVETDLAELIVQLAGDTASHILVPAVHYSRGQVRDLFLRTIARGADLSDDPRELAEVSRLYLRERFLRAGMGVTGANVGVAETGTICVVENEGNGRMCTTLPPLLVTVMGIEKVVPTPGRPRPAASPAAAVGDRGADELLRLAAHRGDARGRAAASTTSCCWTTGGAARWPTPSDGRRSAASAAAPASTCARCTRAWAGTRMGPSIRGRSARS